LPSIDELDTMYYKRSIIGGMTDKIYWSSTEYNPKFSINAAWVEYFGNSYAKYGIYKDYINYVRPVRGF
jgi:hypothetical protein